MSDPDLTPAEEQVRRLLADARHDEPLPADVADRLDGVLDDLRRTSTTGTAPVDLAARRRRRVARNLLVAAAAVVVLGVGISQVDLGAKGEADSSSAGSGADSGAAAESEPQASDDGGDTALDLELGPPVRLSSEDFDQQVQRLESTRGGLTALSDTLGAYEMSQQDAGAARAWCDDSTWGAGRRIAVRYDGERGVLVLRRPVDGSREVDLFLCGDSVPSRSVTVPVG